MTTSKTSATSSTLSGTEKVVRVITGREVDHAIANARAAWLETVDNAARERRITNWMQWALTHPRTIATWWGQPFKGEAMT